MADAPKQTRNVAHGKRAATSGSFTAGPDSRRGTNGGRPKSLKDIEAMLDAEHRTVENMKEVFAQLRVMATENVITRWVDKDGNEHESAKQPDSAFMKLYLERTLGPVKELKVDLSDAPAELLEWIEENLN